MKDDLLTLVIVYLLGIIVFSFLRGRVVNALLVFLFTAIVISVFFFCRKRSGMNTLNEQNATAFLERFWDFGDSIFRRFSIDLDNSLVSEYTAVIDLEALNPEDGGDSRVTVRFTLHRLREHRLDRIPLVVFDLSVAFFNGRVYLDFDSKGTPRNAEDVQRSTFYLAAETCTWEILPLNE